MDGAQKQRVGASVRVPAHTQIREQLIRAIAEGRYAAGSKLPSEPEIAQTFGVSRMTANKAILSLVADGRLRRVQGRGTYVVENANPSTLRCAVLVPDMAEIALDNYYFGTLFFQFQSVAQRSQVECNVLQLSSALGGGALDGYNALLAICPPRSAMRSLEMASDRMRAAAVLGANWSGTSLHCIDSDNIMGAAVAVEHLAALGHRSVLFVGARAGDSNTQDRLRGYRLACRLVGIEVVADPLIAPTANDLGDEVQHRLTSLLMAPHRPTAIFAGGAMVAMATIRLAKRLGLQVPRDLSVVAYDNADFLAEADPPVTTVFQPLGKMAHAACLDLLTQSREGRSNLDTLICEPSLIVRSSTARVPNIERDGT